MTASNSLQEELLYVIHKIEDEIARLKLGKYPDDAYPDSTVADLEHRRDQHYKRLCEIDGLTPDLTD